MQPPTLSDLPAPPPGQIGWPWTIDPESFPSARRAHENFPKISIVTPSFNQGDFLEATIRSVLLQGYPNLEYIIIDGGSSDNSCAIIKRYSPWLKYWVSEPDDGQSNAINKGFEVAEGSVLAWLNSDDVYLAGTLRKVASRFVDPSALALATGYQIETSDIPPKGPKLMISKFPASRLGPSYEAAHIYAPLLHQAATFWTSALWKESGGALNNAMHYAMDADLWLRMLRLYPHVSVIREPLAIFRRHSEQKTAMPLKYSNEIETLRAKFPLSGGFLTRMKIAFIKLNNFVERQTSTHPRLGLSPIYAENDLLRSHKWILDENHD